MNYLLKLCIAGLILLSFQQAQAQNTYGKSIAADFSVSPTGALTYQVPFEVPSHVLGHFPDLGLAFNSQAGDGIAGWGWSISGLSSITRAPATKHHDGFIAPVDYSSTDRFTLDGQRLMLKSGVYGKSGSTYETESYSNLKIEAVGTSRFGSTYGPSYFIVYHPNGMRYWYGRQDSKWGHTSSKLEWSIAKIEDTQGNIVEFIYSLQNETLQLDSVIDPLANIFLTFVYTTKTNVSPIAVGGQFFTNNRLLDKVYVNSGNSRYLNYYLKHENTSNGSKRIKEIELANRFGNPLPPIRFNYLDRGSNRITESRKQIFNNHEVGASPNTGLVTGDFNGDDQLDFLSYNYDREKTDFKGINYRRGSSNGTFYTSSLEEDKVGEFINLFPGNYITNTNELSDHQGIIILREGQNNNLIFEVNEITTSGLNKQREVIWEAPVVPETGTTTWNRPGVRPGGTRNSQTIYFINSTEKHTISSFNVVYGPKRRVNLKNGFRARLASNTQKGFRASINHKLQEIRYSSGDFNGDGITDILAVVQNANRIGNEVYVIDLNPNSETYGAKYVGAFLNRFESWNKLLVGDYNGDGKSDIFHVFQDAIQVYSIKKGSLTYQNHIDSSHFNRDNYVALGDFNGDGKTDVFNSTAENSKVWEFHLSNGKYFKYIVKDIGLKYLKTNWSGKYKHYKKLNPSDTCGDAVIDEYNASYNYTPCGGYSNSSALASYLPLDVDKDGRTDIVFQRVITPNKDDSPYSSNQVDVYRNTKTTTNSISFSRIFRKTKENVGRPRFGHAIYANLDNRNLQNQFAYVETSGYADIYNFDYQYNEEACISSIENNGLETSFAYQGLSGNDWISSVKFLSPYTPSFAQTYKYPYVAYKRNINGFKVLHTVTQKFHGKTRSREFRYGGLVSSVDGSGILGFNFMINSQWRGTDVAAIWSISEYDPLKKGLLKRSWSMSNYPQNASSFPTNNFIAKSSYVYNEITKSNGVYAYLPKKVVSTNGLTGITTTSTTTYDQYYNILNATQTYQGGSKTVANTYFNNISGTGTNYYVGRPKSKNVTTTLGNETFRTSEAYTYSNNFIKTLKTKGNNTSWLTETYEHDSFGNITRKTISGAGIANRVESSKYDTSTGRFLEEATDIEGLKTTYKYDKRFGHLLEETDPFGKKQRFSYDTWDRLVKQTDYLGNTISTAYIGLSAGGLRISTTSSLGGESETHVNRLGWETLNKTRNVLNQWVSTEVEYDVAGKVKRESQPYFSSPTQWTRYKYDNYNRLLTQEMYNGLLIRTTYDGLSVSVNDGTKTVSKTQDAVGNTVSMTDPGGTITYKYYANNTPKETSYGTHKITTKIDGWGRKTELNDPAAGRYTYTYNILGETLSETTPKGITTYVLDDFGKPKSKTVRGDLTNLSLAYNYDPIHKQVTTITGKDWVNGRSYNYRYTYDSNERVTNITEHTSLAQFSKSYSFDAKGRVERESYMASNSQGLQSPPTTFNIKNNYHTNSGQLYKITDSSNNLLWEIKDINTRGQLEEVSLGNGVVKEKKYDDYGLPVSFTDRKGSNSAIYTSNFDFDVLRGNLKSRNNQTANVGSETYQYDSQDRLTQIAINGTTTETQSYAPNGNIKTNPQVGDYQYAPQTRYRVTGIDLNDLGRQHYQDHTPQAISYNAYKKPISIHEQGNGRVDFEYGPMMNRSVAYYGGESEDKTQRDYEKYYSTIMPAEVIKNTTTNNIKIIIYIGGDAYTAPIASIETREGRENSRSFVYLHRDHLGSIMAISDTSGAVIEKTHYSAWGEIAEYWDIKGNDTLGYASILGRGYTGHEHFASVGLIHMNGRMYDGKLRRFLSPDNFIQDPFNTQSFNRYGYVWNNPLKFNDPSGEIAFLAAALIVGKIAAIGAGVGVAVNGIANLAAGQGFFDGAGSAALSGAISGLISFGIGSAVGGISNLIVKGFTQATLHGISGATMAAIQGGDPLVGLASSFVGSAISSVAGGVFGESTEFWNIAGTVGAAGVGGGIAAEISGGKFADGFRNGVIAAGLNHIAHRLTSPKDIVRINTKDKTATVEYTGEDDIIYIDGERIMVTERGLLASSLKDNGYSISKIGPRPLGMGLSDLALEVFGGIGFTKFAKTTFSKYLGSAAFSSKAIGYGSKYFGRFHPKYLPNGVKGVFNKGMIRTGWGSKNGVHTFRTSIGHKPNQLLHIDWFNVPK